MKAFSILHNQIHINRSFNKIKYIIDVKAWMDFNTYFAVEVFYAVRQLASVGLGFGMTPALV